MAVALGVNQAEERYEREVLLQRKAGLQRQVLARHEVARGAFLAVPQPAARRVEQRLVEALAVLGRDPGIPEAPRPRKRLERIVRLVDDHRLFLRQRRHVAGERVLPVHRLLDEGDARGEALEARLRPDAPPQLERAGGAGVLLVAVERRLVRLLVAIEDCRDGDQAPRSEEHTSELQSPCNLVCRLLLEKKKTPTTPGTQYNS